ncbi:hypothetical protein Clacol_005411 [Clathrus columnatus]|uniref:F-box domain-containing protein n=1 Tax=Clathrus columnatus TaxID=1419009 RepID=A0AAV5ADC1_9AGAM|nr:hypothetical protein Clacol_005411 [Clathrus columnatus]
MSSPQTRVSSQTGIGLISSTAHDIAAAIAWSQEAHKHLPHLPLFALESVVSYLSPIQLAHLQIPSVSSRKLDILTCLPTELSLHVLGFVNDAKTLSRAGRVCRTWNILIRDESIWKKLCLRKGFVFHGDSNSSGLSAHQRAIDYSGYAYIPRPLDKPFSFRSYFKSSQTIENNYLHSGHLLRTHRSQDAGIVSSLALDSSWIVVGLANGRVHVFSARTGILARTLSGHQAGVWCVWIVERGRAGMDTPLHTETLDEEEEDYTTSAIPGSLSSSLSSSDMPFQSIFDNLYPPNASPDGHDEALNFDSPNSPSNKQSVLSNSSDGWGQANSLVVSAACDRTLRVWDVKTGYCIHILRGHRSTVRCLKMFHGRPIAVTGGRDATVRIWDIRKGRLLGTLEGHTDSVRCLDVYGDMIVSGSYDCSVRLWSAKTHQCLRVYNGHYHQVYTVAFDGRRIVSGGLDTGVRLWSIDSNDCVALLQGHTALVCQLQLSGITNTVISGSADGRIIIFGIPPESAFNHKTTSPTSTPRPTTLTLPAPTFPQGVSPPSSPSHSALSLHPSHRRSQGSDTLSDTFRIISSITAHTSSITSLQIDEGSLNSLYNGREWMKQRKHGKRKWLISAGTDGRVLLWDIGDNSEGNLPSPTKYSQGSIGKLIQVRPLTEPSDGLWKTAIRDDILVICCSRGGRTILEIWSFKDEDIL